MSLGMMAPLSRANAMHGLTYFQDVTVEVADGQTGHASAASLHKMSLSSA